MERKVLEYVPGEATGATQGLAFLERLIVVDTGIRAIGFPKRLLAVVLDVAFEESCHIAIFLHIGIRDGAETIGVGKNRTGTGGCGFIRHRTHLGVTGIEVELEVLVDLLIDLNAQVGTLAVGIDLHTFLVHIVEVNEELGLFGASTYREVVAMRERRLVDVLLVVVLRHILIILYVAIRTEAEELDEWSNITAGGEIATRPTVVGCSICPDVLEVIVWTHGIDVVGRSVPLGIAVIRNVNLTFLGALGGHEDYAVGATRTIDGGR